MQVSPTFCVQSWCLTEWRDCAPSERSEGVTFWNISELNSFQKQEANIYTLFITFPSCARSCAQASYEQRLQVKPYTYGSCWQSREDFPFLVMQRGTDFYNYLSSWKTMKIIELDLKSDVLSNQRDSRQSWRKNFRLLLNILSTSNPKTPLIWNLVSFNDFRKTH